MKFYAILAIFAISMFANTASAQTVASLGVGDFSYEADSENLSGRTASDLIGTLSNDLNSALLETRKFRVYNSEGLTKRLAEQGLVAQGYYDGSYQGERFQLTGLDYILTGKVSEFGLYDRNSGPAGSKVALVDVDFRLIGTSYGTINLSETATVQVNTDADSSLSDRVVLDSAIQQVSENLTKQIMATLFPIRVMKISEAGEVTLNYGKGFLKAGDTVRLYAGDSIAANGASLGGKAAGTPVATLQVITPSQKFSSAQILENSVDLTRGMKGEIL